MTTEGVPSIDDLAAGAADEDDGRLFCYRHPDRETWVRCGRCDRPICPRCAMQGPVGFRCRECGRPAFDPLTSFTPVQAIGGAAVAVIGGLVAGIVSAQIGFFALFVSFFGGGLIGETVVRVTGYKRGPTMLAIVLGGIVIGSLLAFGFTYATTYADMQAAAAAAADAGYDTADYAMGSWLMNELVWALIGAGAACAGAWSRIR